MVKRPSCCSLSECFSACFHFDINMVITAQTSSGKMVLFELCILRLLSKFISQDGRFAHTDRTLKTEVKCALNEKKLKNILDPAAGDWPFVQANQMAVLAMDCCDMIRQNRHDLASDVWRVLEPLGFLSTIPIQSRFRRTKPDSTLLCLIFQRDVFARHLIAYEHARAEKIMYNTKRATMLKMKWKTKHEKIDHGLYMMIHMERSIKGQNAQKQKTCLLPENHLVQVDNLTARIKKKIILHQVNDKKKTMSMQPR